MKCRPELFPHASIGKIFFVQVIRFPITSVNQEYMVLGQIEQEQEQERRRIK